MEAAVLKRQAEVLGYGLSEGLQDIVQTTWSDLKKAGAEFWDHPLDTAGKYLWNHKQDFLAGAVISILNPKGMANALLVGWSMRGVGTATWRAVKEAGRPGADLSAIKQDLQESISHEGTAFLAAMPMAMAGSVVGRAGANAIFGRNMAAYDLVRGRVSAAEVKNNLWAVKERVAPSQVKTLITDLDGTAYPFWDWFGPAIREAVPEVARRTGISKAEVYKALGEVMDARRTHDWPWVLEESQIARRWKGTPEEFRTQVVEPYYRIIDSHRQQYLKAFPDVIDTLAELKRRGVKVYGLTDSPAFMAKVRIEQTGLAPYLERVFAMGTKEPPVSAVGGIPQALEHGRQRLDAFLNGPGPMRGKVVELPREFEKPDTGGIMLVFSRDPKIRPSERLMVGDSRVKDGGVAQGAGIRFLYARYGTYIPAEYEALSTTLRPGFGTSGPKAAKVYPPNVGEAASYADVLKHLRPKVDYSALLRDTGSSLLVMPRLKSTLGYNLIPYQIERK